MSQPRILIACVGNIFLGDDAFGVEVARRLVRRALPDGVMVADFGIRSFDLALALLGGHDPVILVDAAPRGEPPGTLYLIEPTLPAAPEAAALPGPLVIETHGMDPVKVLNLAAALGGKLPRVLLVGCEPSPLSVDESDLLAGLSPRVQAAVEEAVVLIESLIQRLLTEAAASDAAAAADTDATVPGNVPAVDPSAHPPTHMFSSHPNTTPH